MININKHKKKIVIILVLLVFFIIVKNSNIKNSDNIKILNNINLLNYDNINIKKTRKIIISLTVIPTRFISSEFDTVIDSLSNQQIRPDLVLINMCEKYNRNFVYDKNIYNNKLKSFEGNYDNVEINWCNDSGPATKLFGFETYTKKKFDDDDIIIILDDDTLYNKMLTTYYLLSYELYNCDGVGVTFTNGYNFILSQIQNKIHEKYKNLDESVDININKLYIDNYKIIENMNNTSVINFIDKSRIYGILSWSIKVKHIYNFIHVAKEIIASDSSLFKHDDLVFTLTYKKLKLKMCKISLYMHNILEIGYKTNPLYLDDMQNKSYRARLEYKYRNDYLNNYNSHYTNNYNIKILGKRLFAITIETSKKKKYVEIKDKINNQNIFIKLYLSNYKQTYFCKSNFDLYN